MKNFREIMADLAAGALGGESADYIELISVPPNPDMGDFALPCFTLAKTLRKDPKKIASEAAEKISTEGTPFSEVSAAGPYLNFRLDDLALTRSALTGIHERGPEYGRSDTGAGKTVIVDYSSPNIAKPFHIGHLRSTVIGGALYRLMAALGYNVIGINHLGDWGTQFGMVMAAYDESGDRAELERDPIGYSLKLYVDYNARCESDPASREVAKSWFKRLEDGDPEAVSRWRTFRDLSLGEFERIYKRLNVSFDHYTGESFYNDKMAEALERVRDAGVAEQGDDGAELIRLDDFGMPPFILRKSDGATLYATREIAAAIYRRETYKPDLSLYVVGTPQELHFRQLVESLKLMSIGWAGRLVHVKFGHVHGMSTRKGTVVLLEDVLDEAASKAREKVIENMEAGKLDANVDPEALAEAVGMGALIANDLKHRRERDIHFDWNQALQFEGETGPYLQYTYARIMGILRKSGKEPSADVDFSALSEPHTRALVRKLAEFPEVLETAGRDYEPSFITTYLFELTRCFNLFYTEERVIGSGPEKEPARLLLAACSARVIGNGLALLGVPALEKM